LERIGESLFQETTNSGQVRITDAESVGSKISSGYLEMSNVDLSQEFTDMIITQRAFQAAAKVITTSDLLLQELVNLKR
jgi:flagellar hook protein FlgE